MRFSVRCLERSECMKKAYLSLVVDVELFADEDVLTASDSGNSLINGGLFGGNEDSNGWT